MSDTTLIRRAIAGDEGAAEELGRDLDDVVLELCDAVDGLEGALSEIGCVLITAYDGAAHGLAMDVRVKRCLEIVNEHMHEED